MVASDEQARHQPVESAWDIPTRHDSAMPDSNDDDYTWYSLPFNPIRHEHERVPDEQRTHADHSDHDLFHEYNTTSQPFSPNEPRSPCSSSSSSSSSSPLLLLLPPFPNNPNQHHALSYTIEALDLSISPQHYLTACTELCDFPPPLRTHGAKDKTTKNKKQEEPRHASKHITETEQAKRTISTVNSKTGVTRGNRKAKCRHGGQKRDDKRDDVVNKVCWFHEGKLAEDRKNEPCR